jgi:hypothetical protein
MDLAMNMADKYCQMDPAVEDLVRAKGLKNGMVVLNANSNRRVDVESDNLVKKELELALKENRWGTISGVEHFEGNVYFCTTYHDGTKSERCESQFTPWLVKLDSLADAEKLEKDAIEAMRAYSAILYPSSKDDRRVSNEDVRRWHKVEEILKSGFKEFADAIKGRGEAPILSSMVDEIMYVFF